MREFGKVLASLCAVLFVIGGILVLIFFNIERKAFSSETYKQAFEDQKLYERMPTLLATSVQTAISQNPNAFPFLKELSVEDWQSTISSLLTPDELRALADSALDSTFDYINGRTNSIVISIVPVKAHLAGEDGVTVIRQFLKTQPACTFEQLAQMGLGFLSGSVALCNPPPEAMGLVDTLILSQMQTITAVIPNEVILFSSRESKDLNDPRAQLHMVRSAIRFSPFFMLLLLLAIALFAIRSIRDFFVWWGWPVLMVGAVTSLIGLMGAPLIGWLLQFLIQTHGMIFLPPLLATSIADTASAVAHLILVPVMLQGILLAAIGFGMVILSLFLKRRMPEAI
jgi:hypothetical protein